MKIRDLKEKIKDLPDDMEVLVYEEGGHEGNVFEGIARQVPISKTKHVKSVDGRLKVASRPCRETIGSKKCFVLY